MQSQARLARRATLVIVLLISLVSSTWGPALATQRLSTESDSMLPPSEDLISQSAVQIAPKRRNSSLSLAATHRASQAGVELVPDYTAQALPGDVLTFVHTLTNTGDTGETYELTISGWGQFSWTTIGFSTVFLPPTGVFSVGVDIFVPTDAISGTVNTTIITATATSDPSGSVFAVVRDTVTVHTPDEPPPPSEITLYDLHKGEISSRYVITNLGAEAATTAHSFYESNGSLNGELVATLPAGQSYIVDLATVDFLPYGYTGYAIISADQPITGTVLPDEGACSQPLTDVSLIGPSEGSTRIAYDFTAVITPTDATLPITYTWMPTPAMGQGMSSATYQWTTPGLYTITLSAENCGGAVTAIQTVIITDNPFECSAVSEIPQTECEALVALYESTNGDNWNNKDGWLATNTPCSWYGVTCEAGNITQLELFSNRLSGPIPPEINALSALTYLNLGYNQLNGSIPSEIGNLTALTAIALGNNQLSGIIPSQIGNLTALTYLNLWQNQLNGSIPSQIGAITTLESLFLFGNYLSGPIPPEISNLTALTIVDLSSNQLIGPIPDGIGNLTALRTFYLHENQLSGTIPAGIGNLTALQHLRLNNNQLTGGIPAGIGNLTQLMSLYLNNNQLSGAIPSQIGNLIELWYLDFSSNQLSGSIPTEIDNLTALRWLYLNGNQLTGPIPSGIGNLTALTRLMLNSNRLSGPIPPEIGNLTAIYWLYLNNNQLNGPIPTQIGNLTMLTHINLGGNQLSGSIPPEIGDLTALTSLGLAANQLSGSIPPEIGGLTALTFLVLNNNQLSGAIPPEIGNITTTLQYLYLDQNQLTGPIPPQIGNLTALEWLYLHDNQLDGAVPSAMENLTNLRWLSLNDNPLSGPLPSALPLSLQLFFFSFYDTNICAPPTSEIFAWLEGIPNLFGTGFVCEEGLGSLNGGVTSNATNPIAGVQVNLYRALPWTRWQYIGTTQTDSDGVYQFANLGQGPGIDYRVQFIDPTHQLAPQYYDAKPTIATATPITITPGVTRTGINAVLALPQPPAAAIDTDTGSVAYNPDGTAQITMPAPNPSNITVTRLVTCAVGAPSAVTLTLSTGPQYPMVNVSGDLYRAAIPAADLTGNATLAVIAACSEGTSTTTVGYITLFDPSGYVTDKLTEQPVEDAIVTLYNVPGWEPKTGPDDDRPNTCESNLSKAPDAPWSQPAPTELGIIANADVTPTAPRLPYQHTTVAGYYGWDVSEGCWYVTVEAEGYAPLTSPVVGVPPEVTDLNLELTPLDITCTPLTDVGILGPLNVTSTLYINTLYTFQAVITPTDATEPITYTWTPAPQTGQGTDTATYRWSAPDTYMVTLTAENCGGPVAVTRAFVVEYKEFFMVYLPLVLRN